MAGSAAADSGGNGGGLAAVSAGTNSFALVDGEIWGHRIGTLAIGFRSRVASCRCAGSPDSCWLPWRTAAPMALLQAGHGGRRYCRSVLDFMARDSVVPATRAQARFCSGSLWHGLADVIGRADDQSGGGFDRLVSYPDRAGLQYEHSSGGRGHCHPGGWLWSAEEHRE